MFEKEQVDTRHEVGKMLERLETRVKSGKYKESVAKKAVSRVVTGIVKAKEILKDKFDFNTAKPDEIAALTNAWVAWNKAGVFEGEMDSQLRASLQGLLSETEGDIPAGMKRFARQIWRTEMVGYIIEKVQASTRSDKGDVVEAAMTVQKVTDKEDDPIEALGIAQNLDDAIKSKSVRKSLAARMDATDKDKTGGMKRIAAGLLPDSVPLSLKVVVGGELLTIPPDVSGALTFKNVIKEGNRVYAQLKNGCRGNLAIIELGPPGPNVPPWPGPGPTPPEPTPPGPEPTPPGPEPTPPEPGPPPEPPEPPKPPKIGLVPPVPEGEKYIRVKPKDASFTPSGPQFNESIDEDTMSHELLRDYSDFGTVALLNGLDSIPEDKRDAVLGKIFEKLGQEDPKRAYRLLYDITSGTRKDMEAQMVAGLDEAINTATGEDKKMLEVMKMNHLMGSLSDDPWQLKQLFAKLDTIDYAKLSPGLRESYKALKKYLDFPTRRSVALDLVETSIGVMDSTFNEHDDLEDLKKMSISDLKKELANEGWFNNLDTDEEVYLGSAHVLEALRLAIKYQYPADFERGHIVQNPVQYYYWRIKEGELKEVTIPSGASESIHDPLGRNCISGNKVIFENLFVDREAEFKLFDQYQSGNERFGDHSIWNIYNGSADAFLGADIGGPGLIKGSEAIMKGKFFENNKGIGQIEATYLYKIITLSKLGRYDEARAMCIDALGKQFDKHREIGDKEINERAVQLKEDWLTKLQAQTRLNLQAQGITEATFAPGTIDRPGGGKYTDLEQMITDHAVDQLKKRAYIELEVEVGEDMYDNDVDLSKMSKFERMVFDEFRELNGYGKLDMTEEWADTYATIAKTTAEIIAVSVILAAGGAFIAGAAGAGAGAATGVAAGAGAGAGTATAVGTGGRLAVYGGRGLRIAQRGRVSMVESGYQAGARLATTRAGAQFARFARFSKFTRGTEAMMAGTTRGARAARTLVHATAFVEGQSLLHARVVNPISKEGALTIGTMAVTLYGLDKIQQLLRGGLYGTGVATAANAPAAITTDIASLGRMGKIPGMSKLVRLSDFTKTQVSRLPRLPGVKQVYQGSAKLGQVTGSLAQRGAGGRAAAFGLEYPVEVGAFHLLGPIENWLAKKAGMLTQTEIDAAKEPDWRKQLVHTAGVVLALRLGRLGRRESLPPPREGLLLPPGLRTSHNVDFVAKGISSARAEGVPKEIPVGSRRINAEEILKLKAGDRTLREQYEEALKMPKDTPEQVVARHEKLKDLDRLLAERAIFANEGTPEYPVREQAELARDALAKEYPDYEFIISRKGTRGQDGILRDVTYGVNPHLKEGGKPAEFGVRDAEAEAGGKTEVAGTNPPSAGAKPSAGPKPEATPGNNPPPVARTTSPEAAGSTVAARLEPLSARSGHDVDIVANNISANRFNSGVGMPGGQVEVAGGKVSADKILKYKAGGKTIREHYQDALNMEPGTARDQRLMEIDRYAAERALVGQRSVVEYKTAEEAEAALGGISKDFSGRRFRMFENGGRFNIAEAPPQKVDTIASRISRQRFKTTDGMPAGTVKAGGVEMSQESALSLTVEGKTLRQLYRDALSLPENTPQLKDARLAELAKLDRLLAERMILQNHGAVHYPTRAQAELAQGDLFLSYPSQKFAIEQKNGRFLISMQEVGTARGAGTTT